VDPALGGARPYDHVVDIHLNFSLTQDELRDPRLNLENFQEVVQIDTGEVEEELPGATATVALGSVGKGAANWGADLVLTLTSIATLDGLIDLGQRLIRLAKRLTGAGPKRHLLVRDPTTAGILAVGAYQPRSDLAGGVIVGSWCVTGGNPGIGFDARDAWVTSIQLPDQSVVLIVTSMSGDVVGTLMVPPRV